MGPFNDCSGCDNFCRIVPEMAGKFKALGDPTRLKIIHLLATDMGGSTGVSELASRLGVSQPAVSQHLKTLKNEGLVESRREGFYAYYTMNCGGVREFRENFEVMYANVMENCSRELVRKTAGGRNIRACVIFYSYSGITRGIAEAISSSAGCDIIEIKTKKPYTSFSAYTAGVLRSRKGEADTIEQDEIDVSEYDLLIIGTPVWAWKPSPAINSAVRALKGCEGKPAAIFTTCSNQPGEALPLLGKSLRDKGVEVISEISLDAKDTGNPAICSEILGRIAAALSAGDDDEEPKMEAEA